MKLEGLEIYLYMRIILIIFILSSVIILFLLISLLKHKMGANTLIVGLFSITAILVSGLNVVIMGYLGDGIYPAGDSIIFYLFLIVVALSGINILLAFSQSAERTG